MIKHITIYNNDEMQVAVECAASVSVSLAEGTSAEDVGATGVCEYDTRRCNPI